MSTIIAARFREQEQVQSAISALHRAGFAEQAISTFYVNPPGQHDRYPLGGDHDKSEGAEATDKGVLAGGAAGAAVGLAAAPVIGPVGALVGAYVGSLMGSLAATKEKDEGSGSGDATPREHPCGLMVAVALEATALAQQRTQALQVLQAHGGFDAEIAEGKIVAGDWIDFDPLETPRRIH